MPNSTVLRWRVCCRGQPPFRTCPCLFVSVFVLVRQGHCGKCEPECHVEVHFGAGAFSGDSQTACVTDCVVHRPGMTASSISPKLAEDIFLRMMGHFRQLLIDLAGVRLVRCVHTLQLFLIYYIFCAWSFVVFFFFFSHWSLSSIQKYKTRSSLAVCGCFHTTSAPDMAAVVYFSPWAYKLFFPCRPFWQWEFPPTTPSAWLIFFKLFLQCFLQTTTPLRYVLGCFKSLFQVFWQWLRVICVSGWV